MKFFIDIPKSLGNKFEVISLGELEDYTSKEVIGTKVTIVALDADYEKVIVKIKKPLVTFRDFQKGDKVIFEGLVGTAYSSGTGVRGSFEAQNMLPETEKKVGLPNLK